MEQISNRIYKLIFLVVAYIFLFTPVSCNNDLESASSSPQDSMKSFEGQFRAIWTALDMNYPTWDYEREKFGLNWDEVFMEYLPKFKELDKEKLISGTVPDSTILNLYTGIMGKLHDGHTLVVILNISTGKEIYSFLAPAKIHNKKDSLFVNFYDAGKVDADETIEKADNKGVYYKLYKDYISYFRLGSFYLTKKGGIDDPISDKSVEHIWKLWFSRIQELNMHGLLKGVIIDIRNNGGGNPNDYRFVLGALHAPEDTTNNNLSLGYIRYKGGIGRYDYLSPMPFTLPVYRQNHANIKVPVVVLADMNTASAGDIMCLAAKKLAHKKMLNVRIIGTHTWGGFSGVGNQPTGNGIVANMGWIGDKGLINNSGNYEASFLIRVPTYTYLTDDMQIIEGQGVKPDIEVPLDENLYKWDRRDNQLERALEYIRTGK